MASQAQEAAAQLGSGAQPSWVRVRSSSRSGPLGHLVCQHVDAAATRNCHDCRGAEGGYQARKRGSQGLAGGLKRKQRCCGALAPAVS